MTASVTFEQKHNKVTVQELLMRTRKFSLDMIFMFKALPKTVEAQVIGKQLLRSATSVTANYRAACRGRSTREFIAKLTIVVEEADESLMWLEMLEDAKICTDQEITRLKQEARELLFIFSASRKSAKINLGNKLKSTNQQIKK